MIEARFCRCVFLCDSTRWLVRAKVFEFEAHAMGLLRSLFPSLEQCGCYRQGK
jgi:hypothetical protein